MQQNISRESATGTDQSKATKYAAAHLLSKVYLTRGSAITDQRGQLSTDMDSAYYYARRVIDSSKYTLLNNYSDLWDVNNMGGIVRLSFLFSLLLIRYIMEMGTNLIYIGGHGMKINLV